MLARRFVLAVFLVTGLVLLGPAVSTAGTLYWDTTPGGTMTAGNGNWSSTDLSWSLSTSGDSTLSAWPGAGNVADFYPSGTSTVTVLGTVSADGVTFDGSGYTLSGGGTINLTNAATITANQAATINAVLSGSNGMTLNGSALLTLGGSNIYTGNTTISGGTLQLGNGTTNGYVAGNILDNSGLIFNNLAAETFAGAITGTGALLKTAAGTLVLSNAGNLYSGGTTISAGIVQATVNNAAGTNTITLSGGTLQAGGSGVTLANPILLTASTTSGFDTPTNSNLTLTGNLSGAGNVNKTSGYSLILSGSNSGFSGTFTNLASNTFFNGANAGSAGANWVINAGNLANMLANNQS